ncbi:EAL domain-containing protein [Dyella sp. ASV21]|uniref:EAL domain-containing protein n=1 Tax=Dyella sp. ASV21 TaxID=2795114 RepID=UPI0018EC9D44
MLPFVLVVAVMIGLCVVSLDILSAARGFVGGESHWSKGQKIATAHLERYLTDASESEYQQFRQAIAVTQGDRNARLELDKPNPDMAIVEREFVAGGIDHADVPGMARLYRYFHAVPPIARAIAIWQQGDELIDQTMALGEQIHARATLGEHDAPSSNRYRAQLRDLDERLTPLENAFSAALGQASSDTTDLLRVCLCLIGAVLALGAVRRARRLLRDHIQVERALRASEDRFQLAVAGSSDGLWDWDRRSGHIYLSPRLRQMLGLSGNEDARGPSIFRRLHPIDRHCAKRAVVAHVRHGQSLDLEFRVPQVDGGSRWFRARGTSVRDPQGVALRTAGSLTEITEQRRAEVMLFAAKERAEVTLQSIGDAVITTDAHGRVQYLNPSAERLAQCSLEDARGRAVSSICCFVSEATGQPITDPIRQVWRGRNSWSSKDRLELAQADGRTIGVDLTVTPIRDRQGHMDGIVLVIRDVSSDREHAAQLAYQASHDGLTGLINRREFERRLGLSTRAMRSGGPPFAVLYLDLDQFKVVNDTCSHAAGDELLRQVAHLFTHQVRSTDAVARLGGDEFVILLEDCPADAARKIAENLRATLGDQHFVFGERSFTISASIGLVCLSNEQIGREEILGAADAACHLAKEKGRNRVQTNQLDNGEVAERQSEMCWVSRIQAALTDGRLRLYAQDIVDMRQPNERRHVEILLRMLSEDGSLVPPRAFIPAAERYGLMPSIDRWVVHSTFAVLRRLIDHEPERVPRLCAINLSGTSICEEGFAVYLHQQFAEHDIPPSLICFEITETAAISSLSRATTFIKELRALGCLFSLDDFGAGMSSFTYLKHLPVDFVKIEGSFVKDMIEDPIDFAMVEAINNIGHVTGKLTIAECVSSTELVYEVARLGIDFAQGFALSVPRPFVAEAYAAEPLLAVR